MIIRFDSEEGVKICNRKRSNEVNLESRLSVHGRNRRTRTRSEFHRSTRDLELGCYPLYLEGGLLERPPSLGLPVVLGHPPAFPGPLPLPAPPLPPLPPPPLVFPPPWLPPSPLPPPPLLPPLDVDVFFIVRRFYIDIDAVAWNYAG
mmetsp:Transcript_13801/g.23439  ORF Transcript_13801/g.23439 Transcript_13801/m.23439 type:complete len:147 (+) Transcript_13801:592-1032(+)